MLKPRAPGTEFSDAETERQKPSLKSVKARRDENLGVQRPEIPAETPYSASSQKPAVCEEWMVEAVGHKLETHHPVVEPVSALSRERKFAMQRRARKSGLIA